MNNDYLLTQYTVIYNSEIVLASQTQKRTRRFQNTKRFFCFVISNFDFGKISGSVGFFLQTRRGCGHPEWDGGAGPCRARFAKQTAVRLLGEAQKYGRHVSGFRRGCRLCRPQECEALAASPPLMPFFFPS